MKEQFLKMSNRGASVGTEELGHLEMIGAIVYQLTKNLTEKQVKEAGFEDYFVDHTTGIYPQSAAGTPWTAASMQSKGDPITDLHENMAAEPKPRKDYKRCKFLHILPESENYKHFNSE